jgi:hypothetical protein
VKRKAQRTMGTARVWGMGPHLAGRGIKAWADIDSPFFLADRFSNPVCQVFQNIFQQ